MKSSVDDHHLASAENILTESEYSLPVAWGLGFLVDNKELLVKLLAENGHKDKAESVESIVDWTLFGDPLYRDEDDGENEDEVEED